MFFFHLAVVLIVHPDSAYRRDVCRFRYQIQVLVFKSRALILDVVEARITEGSVRTKL